MCGIAGYYDRTGAKPKSERRAATAQMCAAIRHRGPDSDGFYDSENLSMGMRRLSIIDLAAGDQPLFNEDRSLSLIFNGEIYNYVELRAELESAGHTFSTDSDGEPLLHLFEDRGIAALDSLNGMFSICLWDETKKEGYLVRDRLGIKPLYYRATADELIFASEIKSLLAHMPDRELDERAILQFLQYMFIPAPSTPFRDIKKLLPGHYIKFSGQGICDPASYWEIPTSSGVSKTKNMRTDFLELLEDSVRIQLRSDVPVGIFLSGGIDSSLVAAMVAKQVPPGMHSFTASYKHAEVSERPYADLVAKKFGYDHHVIEIGPEEALNALPASLWHLDEPHADSANIGAYFVSKLAADHVKVVLAGTGGDELFAGYHRHLQKLDKRIVHQLPDFVLPLLRTAGRIHPKIEQKYIRRITNNWTPKTGFLSSFLEFTPGEIAKFFTDISPTDTLDAELRRYYSGREDDTVNKMLFTDAKFYLPDDPLLLFDKLAMAWSLEGRVPLLDHRLVEFCFRLPGATKLPGSSPKELLKEWARSLLPPEILDRPKWGFAGPVKTWISAGLDRITFDLINSRPDSRKTWYWGLRDGALEQKLKSMSVFQIYHLVVLEVWCRLFLEGVSPDLDLEEMARL